MNNRIRTLMLTALLPLLAVSCLQLDPEEGSSPENGNNTEDPFASMNIDDTFDYATEQEILVDLTAPEFLSNAVFQLYTLKNGNDSLFIGKGTFDQNGQFRKKYTVAVDNDSLIVRSQYLGMIDRVSIAIRNQSASHSYLESYQGMGETGVAKKPVSTRKARASVAGANTFNYGDTYNGQGVPDNLAFADVVDQTFLDDVNASLPEYKPVPTFNPDYLNDDNETRVVLTKEADVWVTYVTEGAGYRNALGYYTYTLGNAPESANEIEHTIIFPNVSNSGSGGGLLPGDRVYLGRFPANTVVEWFLVSDGWNGSAVGNGRGIKYGNPDFNSESTPEKRKHLVALWDEARNRNILSFEDLDRDGPSDDDFNDAIFYARYNPVDAVDTSLYQKSKAAVDSDGDGINDNLDDFPFDPNAAFQNYSPSNNSVGTMVYEDLWPNQGDYDFNDLVVGYSFELVANADNRVSRIEASFEIENIGGALENGFALFFDLDPDLVESVEGQVINSNYLTLNANGTEAGLQADETVIFVIDNAIDAEGETIDLTITFNTPQSTEDLGSVPFNPFMVVNEDRTREVHLPDSPPTSRAAYLGEEDDYSDPQMGRYYKSERNLPWAMNLFGDFQAPPERIPIIIQYPRFELWANSGGTQALDWYSND